MLERDQMILVIEDDEDDQLLIKTVAEEARFDAEIVFLKGSEQVDYYLFRDMMMEPFSFVRLPTIIILDLKLQGKSGIEILAKIKAHKFLRQIPVLVLSASIAASDVQECYMLGCAGYFVKPTEQKEWFELFMAIENYWCRWACRPLLEGC